MILYLQSNTNGTFAITEKNNFKSELYPYDYYALLDNISCNITYQNLVKLIQEKFNCKKLIIDL